MAAKSFLENADFQLDDVTWKVAWGEPGGTCSCLGPMGLFSVRFLSWFFWISFWMWRFFGGNLRYYYLTHWTATFELVYLSFAVLSNLMAITTFHGIPDGKGRDTPWFARVAWAMQGTALVMSILVFLLYWVLDFSFVCAAGTCPVIDFPNVAMHGLNAVIMVIDTSVDKVPMYLTHIFLPVAYAACYMTFNIVYQMQTGQVVYGILDWEGAPSRAASIAAAVLLVVLPLFYGLAVYCSRSKPAPADGGGKPPAE